MDVVKGYISDEEDALLNEAICMSTNELEKVVEAENENARSKTPVNSKSTECKPIVKEKTEGDPIISNSVNKSNYFYAEKQKQNHNMNHLKFEDNVKNKPEDFHGYRKRPRESNVDYEDAKICRTRQSSESSSTTNSSDNSKKHVEYETDPAVLARRQKEIDYGKNTIGYDKYIEAVPKETRTREHPRTPPKYIKYSRRGWDGMVKLWRKQLHQWDPPQETGNND